MIAGGFSRNRFPYVTGFLFGILKNEQHVACATDTPRDLS